MRVIKRPVNDTLFTAKSSEVDVSPRTNHHASSFTYNQKYIYDEVLCLPLHFCFELKVMSLVKPLGIGGPMPSSYSSLMSSPI